jgi:hypothetical protein
VRQTTVAIKSRWRQRHFCAHNVGNVIIHGVIVGMNAFIYELTEKLRLIYSETDLTTFYQWLHSKQAEVAESATDMNRLLGLSGETLLQPDLPCLSVGSLKGLVILAANPGWSEKANALEDAYCRASAEQYIDILLNFFKTHPTVVGERVRWWSGPIGFYNELFDGKSDSTSMNSTEKWKTVGDERMLGGWELFPWHSSKDGISAQIQKTPWLHSLAKESIQALLRVNPKAILVASKAGYDLIRHDLLRNIDWLDSTVGSKTKLAISYAKLDSGTEIIAVQRQIFASFKVVTNKELFAKIREFRELAN